MCNKINSIRGRGPTTYFFSLLHNCIFPTYYPNHFCAEVVELVDALDSGSSGCKPVGVRVPPSAIPSLEPRLDTKKKIVNE
jgi:hypothetical protein